MKKIKLLITENLKKVITISIAAIIIATGAAIYAVNSINKKGIDKEGEILASVDEDNTDEESSELIEETKAEEIQNAELEKAQEQSAETNDQSQKVEPVKEDKKEQSKPQVQSQVPKENTKKQEVKHEKKASTYTSKRFGLSFDMPASWDGNYVVQEDDKTIRVFMKHAENGRGIGLLFIITTDIEGYGNGDYVDTIGGVQKHQNINNRQYLIGGPTDCRIEQGDPLMAQYREMTSQLKDVLSTLRG